MCDPVPSQVVYVCPERDIECGPFPKSWCATCPKHPSPTAVKTEQKTLDTSEEPSWAHKNIAAPSDLKVGDYVFASRWTDCDPGDPWRIGNVAEIGPNWISFEFNGRRYPNAMRITAEQAERIITQYPALENRRGPLPYKAILDIFNPSTRCSKCGLTGLHACIGEGPSAAWSDAEKERLCEVLSLYKSQTHHNLGSSQYFKRADPISRTDPDLEVLRLKAQAFDTIKARLNSGDLDGILARLSEIIDRVEASTNTLAQASRPPYME